jgi:hypothetical protein
MEYIILGSYAFVLFSLYGFVRGARRFGKRYDRQIE